MKQNMLPYAKVSSFMCRCTYAALKWQNNNLRLLGAPPPDSVGAPRQTPFTRGPGGEPQRGLGRSPNGRRPPSSYATDGLDGSYRYLFRKPLSCSWRPQPAWDFPTVRILLTFPLEMQRSRSDICLTLYSMYLIFVYLDSD